VDLAARLARQLTASRIAAEPRLDVEGGAAGALLALLALHEKIAEGWVLEAARACARHLLERQVATGREDGGWPAPDGLMHAGFAHGAGGIACALARLHERTGDGELLSAARRGLRYERAIYSPADRNWPLQKKNGGSAVMTAWCHGAAGVALSRALVPASFLDDELVEELELALATTESAPQSRFDHLCCGNLGRADALLTAGLRRHQDARLAAAAALARAVAARAVERGRLGVRPAGFESGAFRPGFFQGLSGIGYELLRVAAPRALPSVLGFEAGTGGEA